MMAVKPTAINSHSLQTCPCLVPQWLRKTQDGKTTLPVDWARSHGLQPHSLVILSACKLRLSQTLRANHSSEKQAELPASSLTKLRPAFLIWNNAWRQALV